jgi:hypothetical protein
VDLAKATPREPFVLAGSIVSDLSPDETCACIDAIRKTAEEAER